MENILGISYLVAGLIVAIWIWNKDYKHDYELVKSQNDVEDETCFWVNDYINENNLYKS